MSPVEFAPGIPRKDRMLPIPLVEKTQPVKWKFGLQLHDAERAGRHFDLRIGDPQGNAHSWAIQSLPNPGEKVLAVQQPTHTVQYMPFEGKIEAGYGKGDVKSVRFEPTEVVKAGPDQVTFHLHKGHLSEEFTLIRTDGKQWLLVNHTSTRTSRPQLPSTKTDYREIPFEKAVDRIGNTGEVMAAKIDGGHVTALLQTGKPVRIFSYRPAKNETGLIEHTHRVSKALKTIVPKGLGETILRGELYARDRAGARPLPSQTIGGMMNANVWLSRERQKEHGALRFVPFDVVKWRGRSFEDATYAKKLEVLQEVKRQIPWMELPDMARTPLEKARMLKAIKTKQHPQTQEGVILWELDSEKPPVKAKITSDHDVIIKGFDPGKGALLGKGIGAIQYGDPKHPQDVKGRVGTGMSLAIRKDMMEKPELYNGKIMKLKAQGVFPSGALRAPRFLSLHLDSLTGSEKVAFSSMSAELRKIVGRQP